MFRRFALFLVAVLVPLSRLSAALPPSGNFARTNLVAWCIVPFDSQKRGPEERAAMLDRLGIHRLAYDWRAEHIPTFDAEVAAMRKHGIEITAWWFPAALNDEAKAILACLERNKVHPQLWVTMGTEPESDAAKLAQKLDGAVTTLVPICAAAAKLGCTVALYNHLGWFGEPMNQVAIIAKLKAAGHTNVGIVYNFHHAHSHIDDFAEQLRLMQPHLLVLNLNGMIWEGDRVGKKIIPLGTGEEEVRLLQIVNASGWRGPVGLIGHTEEDAEVKLKKELSGLEKLAPLAAQAPSPVPARKKSAAIVGQAASLPSSAGSLPAVRAAIVAGQSGPALDARVTGLVLDGKPWFRKPPLRVAARVRLGSKAQFNLIAASEAKSSPTHWELYTYAGTGELSLYLPGATPAELRSGKDICDGQWHSVVLHYSTEAARLSVDGRELVRQAFKRSAEPDGNPAQIAVGRLVEGGLGCDGLIEDLVINDQSSGKGETASLTPWRRSDGVAVDLTTLPTPATPAVGGTRPLAKAMPKPAAGEPAISGREPGSQGEKDWVDNRWQETDVGPFLASNLRLPDGSVIAKALSIRTSHHNGLRVVPDSVAMVYDTQTCTLRGTWSFGSGRYLSFDPARFGLIGMPKIAGEVAFLTPPPDPTEPKTRFVGVRLTALGAVLEYEIEGSQVLETQGAAVSGGHRYFLRSFQFAPSTKPRTIVLFETDSPAVTRIPGVEWDHILAGEKQPMIAVIDSPSATTADAAEPNLKLGTKSWLDATGKKVHAGVLIVPPGQSIRTVKVACWPNGPGSIGAGPSSGAERVKPFGILDKVGRPAELIGQRITRWPTLTTRGQRGPDTDFLAVDTLTLPYDNPAKALLFASGVDFTPDGAGYLCTIHGDVWRVTGIDDSLRELKWQRYATGLFQPLGLKVRDGKVFVLGRDRITRLHDENGDGEADFYENFFDGIATSTGGHDYVTCLETDSAGNFYYVDPLGLHRVAADGSRQETLATGFRNPNGSGVRPDGRVLTAAPQQGTWTPSSGIWEVRPDNVGLYGGYGGPKVTATRPLGYDAPLCWLPHGVDNSSGSQVWIPPGQWGPLGGQLLHLLWGRCTAMLVLRDEVGGSAGGGARSTDTGEGAGAAIAVNGAVVPLPVKFLSGPNRATFNPKDGALYVAGSTGWQTSAVKDGALQRVRFTGRTPSLPVRWAVKPGGLEVTFTRRLDPKTGNDPGSYSLKQWGYRYAEQYGSKDWSVADPQKEGRDEVSVKSAKVIGDGRTVFLEIPDLKPVMQFELKYNVDGEMGGKALRGSFWGTINQVSSQR